MAGIALITVQDDVYIFKIVMGPAIDLTGLAV
jgi:hypothetical protein